MNLPVLKPRHCDKCGYDWYPRKKPGKICPNCKRPYGVSK